VDLASRTLCGPTIEAGTKDERGSEKRHLEGDGRLR